MNHLPLQAAIIDLDGTMVDTLGDFHVVLQHTLADMGCHPIELARVDREFLSLTVGKGTDDLLRRSLAHAWGLPDDAAEALEAVPEAWQHYQRHYDRLNGQHADVFPGVSEGLRQLRELGVPLACLPAPVRRALNDVALRFGPVLVRSTHRGNRAFVRTDAWRGSYHRDCRAADFRVSGNPAAILAFLRARHELGGVKRYRNGLFHIDNGPRRSW